MRAGRVLSQSGLGRMTRWLGLLLCSGATAWAEGMTRQPAYAETYTKHGVRADECMVERDHKAGRQGIDIMGIATRCDFGAEHNANLLLS
jgi:hypothetical protein